MKNAKLAEAIRHELEGDWLDADQIAEVLEALRTVVLRECHAGEKVHLREFGTFEKSFREKTTVTLKGKQYIVPEHNVLIFRSEDEADAEMNQE